MCRRPKLCDEDDELLDLEIIFDIPFDDDDDVLFDLVNILFKPCAADAGLLDDDDDLLVEDDVVPLC